MENFNLEEWTNNALKEDIGDGDHSSIACIPSSEMGKAQLLVKQDGIIAGIEVAQKIALYYFPDFIFETFKKEGEEIKIGETVFIISGPSVKILSIERLILNVLQRMSGIATYTQFLNQKIKGSKTKLLDTRKTTPNFRYFEKLAVKIGGGENHRFGLYDMIMLKDNHIDYAGGIKSAITKTKQYLKSINKDLKIEVEVRDFKELDEVLMVGGIHRIMLDNFTPNNISKALKIINGKFETEASGGINESTLSAYADTGVDYISIGALTHQIKSLDLSLKAI